VGLTGIGRYWPEIKRNSLGREYDHYEDM
jgi:hypothetical protein